MSGRIREAKCTVQCMHEKWTGQSDVACSYVKPSLSPCPFLREREGGVHPDGRGKQSVHNHISVSVDGGSEVRVEGRG